MIGNVTLLIRYTRSKMARRLLAFALAWVVIGAPVAGSVCGTLCAEHVVRSIDPMGPVAHHHSSDGASRASQHHHHSAVQPAPVGGAALGSISHECAQPDAVVTETRDGSRGTDVAAAATVAWITPPLALALLSSSLDRRHGPPAPIRATSPLRI